MFHDYIGPEHIYVALLEDADSGAVEVLEAQGVERGRALAEAEGLLVREEERELPGRKLFTAQAKRVLELSMEEARALECNYVGTEHLILGVLRVHKAGELQGAGCLEAVTLERARPLVLERKARLSEPAYAFDASFRPAGFVRFFVRLWCSIFFTSHTLIERIVFALGLPRDACHALRQRSHLNDYFQAAERLLIHSEVVFTADFCLLLTVYLLEIQPRSYTRMDWEALMGLFILSLSLAGVYWLLVRDLHAKALALWAARDAVPPT